LVVDLLVLLKRYKRLFSRHPIGIMPTEIPAYEKQLAPAPVQMETDDDSVRRRSTYKNSFGSMRALAAASALEPFIQPATQNKASAQEEMDTVAAPRLTFMQGVGRIHPLAPKGRHRCHRVLRLRKISIVLQTQLILERPPSSYLLGQRW
jgi:hypothetical protein